MIGLVGESEEGNKEKYCNNSGIYCVSACTRMRRRVGYHLYLQAQSQKAYFHPGMRKNSLNDSSKHIHISYSTLTHHCPPPLDRTKTNRQMSSSQTRTDTVVLHSLSPSLRTLNRQEKKETRCRVQTWQEKKHTRAAIGRKC